MNSGSVLVGGEGRWNSGLRELSCFSPCNWCSDLLQRAWIHLFLVWLLGKKTQKELEKEQLLFCPSLFSLTSLWPHLPRPGQPLSAGEAPWGPGVLCWGPPPLRKPEGPPFPALQCGLQSPGPLRGFPACPLAAVPAATARLPSQAVLLHPSRAPSLSSPVSLVSLPPERHKSPCLLAIASCPVGWPGDTLVPLAAAAVFPVLTPGRPGATLLALALAPC